MKMSDMFPSQWLGQSDAPSPIQATIREIKREPIKGQRGTEVKTTIYFRGDIKPWILNKGNAKRMVALFGDDSSNWIGKTIEIYTDPTVEFAGEIVGGLRLRAPSGQQTQQQPHQPTNGNGFGDPFANGFDAPVEKWDITDGTNKQQAITTQEVQDFLADAKVPITSIWVKPAGAPREQAKTADKWNFTAPKSAPANDPIPF